MVPKDKDPILKKSGVIYRYKCDRVECDEDYIGESERTFVEKFKEHLKAPSPIYDHYNTSGHNVTIDNFSIVGREDQNLMRTIKEAIYMSQAWKVGYGIQKMVHVLLKGSKVGMLADTPVSWLDLTAHAQIFPIQ